jgi:hypothetical protein
MHNFFEQTFVVGVGVGVVVVVVVFVVFVVGVVVIVVVGTHMKRALATAGCPYL